jgi:beta-barrel assembly-enhancing protease
MIRLILAVTFAAVCSPAYAQLGGLLNKVQKAAEQKEKFDELNITDEEERQIGEDVSAKIRARFGVAQDGPVHQYVTLVGLSVARESERPKLPWTFIVLDTDGVNAFASPGGLVHITRGALGLLKNEAELAGVLAHEIGHVAHKHTVNAIKKSNAVQMGTGTALKDRGSFLNQLSNKAYEMVLENAFDRGDEVDADKAAVQYTQKAGYAPATLADFLTRLDERNKDQPERNGLFASHPETQERIDKIRQTAGAKRGANGEARYKQHITYTAVPITAIAAVEAGAAGLTGSKAPAAGKDDQGKEKDKKAEEPKKKGFGIGSLKQTVAPEKQTAQVSASGGSRGVGPDRAAKGGSNPSIVKVATVTDAEVDAFKRALV